MRATGERRLNRKIRKIDRVYAQVKKGWCTIEDVEHAARVGRGDGGLWLEVLRAVLSPVERLEEREIADFHEADVTIRQYRVVGSASGLERVRAARRRVLDEARELAGAPVQTALF